MVHLTLNIPWATGRNICYQTLSLHPWGFWESLVRPKMDRCVRACAASLLFAACEEIKCCRSEWSVQKPFPTAFNTSQYQISTTREETRGEVLKYLIFESIWGHCGNTSCVVCWQNGSVCCWREHSDSAGQLNTRTASQAAFFSKCAEVIQVFDICDRKRHAPCWGNMSNLRPFWLTAH